MNAGGLFRLLFHPRTSLVVDITGSCPGVELGHSAFTCCSLPQKLYWPGSTCEGLIM